MNITIKECGNKGFATASDKNSQAGIMTYSIPHADYIIIDYTEVEEPFKGKGVGKELLYKIVDMARDKGIHILPLCSFAKAMFDKTDEIKDVLKN